MLALPSPAKTGIDSQRMATATATAPTATMRSARAVSRHSFAARRTSIKTIPSGMPLTRQAFEMSSAGEVTSTSR